MAKAEDLFKILAEKWNVSESIVKKRVQFAQVGAPGTNNDREDINAAIDQLDGPETKPSIQPTITLGGTLHNVGGPTGRMNQTAGPTPPVQTKGEKRGASRRNPSRAVPSVPDGTTPPRVPAERRTAQKETGNEMNYPIKLIVGAIISVCALIFFLATYFTVDPYERAVVTRFGEVVGVAEPGLHFKAPFVNSTHFFRTDIQSIVAPRRDKEKVNTYTVDNQEIDVIFSVFYRIPAEQVEYIYTNVPDVQERLYTMAVDRVKAEMGKINVTHVAERRGELRDKIKDNLTESARALGVEVTDVQLTNLEYTESFRQAVEKAAAAKAGVETQEYNRQQAQKIAEMVAVKAEGEANAARATAKGVADSNLFTATAEAKAIEMKGKAEAAAIEAQSRALSQNPSLIELRRAERWDGKLPQQVLGTAPIPFMPIAKPGQ